MPFRRRGPAKRLHGASPYRKGTAMAVITTYDLDFLQDVESVVASNSENGADAVGLAGGGFAYAVTVTGGTISFFEAFDAAPDFTGSSALNGVDPSIAQLNNGNLVVSSTTTTDTVFTVFEVDGDAVVAETLIGDSGTSASDVAALDNGGFVIVTQDNISATNNDIDVHIRNANGTSVTSFTIDNTSADDRNPSVTGLTNGNFVVAWERHVAFGATQLWAAVYTNSGVELAAPAANDILGGANEDVSTVALPGGGFAFVYEDNAAGTRDIRLRIFTATGETPVDLRITTAASAETNPAIALLSNGLIAVTYQEDASGPNDINTHLMLVDPARRSTRGCGFRPATRPTTSSRATISSTGSTAGAAPTVSAAGPMPTGSSARQAMTSFSSPPVMLPPANLSPAARTLTSFPPISARRSR
jgi:hypothetical protein